MKVELIDSMGSDLSVVNAARVSFEKRSDWVPHFTNEWDSDTGGTQRIITGISLSSRDQKLIQYLAKHKHKSPFNHCFASFRVKAPIFVARQLVKHEYLPWNEVSRRYVDSEPEFYVPEVWRKKSADKKQGSSEERIYSYETIEETEGRVFTLPEDEYLLLIEHCKKVYNDMLAGGVCPEQARMVLPQSMMTEWIWSGSLFAFAKMAKLRLDPHTQKETREIALMIDEEMAQAFPHSWAALLEHYDGA